MKQLSITNLTVTVFRNVTSGDPNHISLNEALRRIKHGTSKELVEQIRDPNLSNERSALKRGLPSVCFAGFFSDRKTLIQSNGLAILDFDEAEDLDKLIVSLRNDKYIFSAWISPSGNGVKALVKIPIVKFGEEYKEYYKGLLNYFKDLNPDTQTNELNRLCFESYDPDIHINEDSLIFKDKFKIEVYVPNRVYKSVPVPQSEQQKIDNLFKWWCRNYEFTKGRRNNDLFVLACKLFEFGVSDYSTSNLLYASEEDGFPLSEIQSIMRSAKSKVIPNSKSFD